MSDKADVKGGNGNIYFANDGTAKKYLRNTSSKEKKERFKRELDVTKGLSDSNMDGIVKIFEVHIDEKIEKSYIKMKKYDGNLRDICSITKGNVKNSLKMTLPVIKALKRLSELEPAIYHRDLKPDNILYSKDGDDYILYLTDFGICFLKDDQDRLTPDYVAVGARMYMSPESELGKVEIVNEKSDIYSIGKLIWYMINGEEYEALPYNLWFIDEYDLVKKYPDDSSMIAADVIISSCLAIDPDNRCGYDELILMIETVIMEDFDSKDIEKQDKVKRFSEKREVELIEIRKKNKLIVNQFSTLYIEALKYLNEKYPDFELIKRLLNGYRKPINGADYTASNVENNSAHYLFSVTYDSIYVAINYNPGKEKYANITFEYSIYKSNKQNKICIMFSDNDLLLCRNEKYDSILKKDVLICFLEDMIFDYIDE